MKKALLVIFAAFLIISCSGTSGQEDDSVNINKNADNPAKFVAGTYEGFAYITMDPSSMPQGEYPGTFTIEEVDGKVNLKASIRPGKMPFPVNYKLKDSCELVYSETGYKLQGSFTVSVTTSGGKELDMKEFYFTLNEKSHIFIDKNKNCTLNLYYPDEKMQSGKIRPGIPFFLGKKVK